MTNGWRWCRTRRRTRPGATSWRGGFFNFAFAAALMGAGAAALAGAFAGAFAGGVVADGVVFLGCAGAAVPDWAADMTGIVSAAARTIVVVK